MTYNITRNYDTDRSRTDVQTILVNVTKKLNDARGREVPTHSVFEQPEIVDEESNHFEIAVRPTVTKAGFEPTELLGSVNYDGFAITVLGQTLGGERDTLRVKVEEGENSRNVDMERKEEIWAQLDN